MPLVAVRPRKAAIRAAHDFGFLRRVGRLAVDPVVTMRSHAEATRKIAAGSRQFRFCDECVAKVPHAP
jgi:hypothetical protein